MSLTRKSEQQVHKLNEDMATLKMQLDDLQCEKFAYLDQIDTHLDAIKERDIQLNILENKKLQIESLSTESDNLNQSSDHVKEEIDASFLQASYEHERGDLLSKIKHLEGVVQLKANELNVKHEKISSLLENMHEIEQQFEIKVQIIEELKKDIVVCKEIAEERTCKIEELNEGFKTKNVQSKKFVAVIKKLKSQLAEKSSDDNEQIEELSKLNTTLEELRLKLDNESSQSETLNTNIQLLRDNNDKLKLSLNTKIEEIEAMDKKMIDFKNESRRTVEEQDYEYKRLQETLVGTVDNMEEVKKKLCNKSEILLKREEQLQHLNETLVEQHDLDNRNKQQIEELDIINKNLTIQLEQMGIGYEEQSKELVNMTEKNFFSENSKHDLTELCDDLEQKHKSYIIEFENKIAERNEKIISLTENLQDVESQLQVLIEKRENYSKESVTMEDVTGVLNEKDMQIKKFVALIKKLKMKIAEQKTTIETLEKHKCSGHDIINADYLEQLDMLIIDKKKLEDINESLKVENFELLNRCKEIHATHVQLNDQINTYEVEISNLNSSLPKNTNNADVELVTTQLQTTKEEFYIVQENLNAAEEQITRLEGDIVEKNECIKFVQTKSTQQSIELSSMIQQYKDNIIGLERKFRDQTDKESMLQKIVDVESVAHNQTIQSLSDEKKLLCIELAGKNTVIDDLNLQAANQFEENKKLTLEVECISDNLNDSRAQITALYTENENVKSQLKTSVHDLSEFKAQTDLSAQVLSARQKETKIFKSQLLESENIQASLNEKIEQMEKQLNYYKSEYEMVDELKHVIKTKSNELESHMNTIVHKVEIINKLNQKLEELEQYGEEIRNVLESEVGKTSDFTTRMSMMAEQLSERDLLINNKDEIITGLDSRVKKILLEMETLQNTLNVKNGDITVLTNSVTKSDNNIDKLTEENERQRLEIDQSILTNICLNETVRDLGIKQELLLQDFNEKVDALQQFESTCHMKDEEIKNAVADYKSSLIEVTTLNERNSYLETQIKVLSDGDGDFERLKHQLDEQENEKVNLIQTIEDLNINQHNTFTELTELIGANEKLNADLEEMIMKVDDQQIEIEDLTKTVTISNSEKQMLEVTIADITYSLDMFKSKLEEANIHREEIGQKHDLMEGDLNKTLDDFNNLQIVKCKLELQISDLEDEKNNILGKLESITAEKLREEVKTRQRPELEIQHLNEVETMRQSMCDTDNLEYKYRELEKEYEDLSSEKKQMKNKLDTANVRCDKMMVKLKQFKEKNERLSKLVEEQQRKIQNMDQSFSDTRQTLQQEKMELQVMYNLHHFIT